VLRPYPFLELLQDVDLNQSLLMEALLVPDDLDGHQTTSLVVHTSHYLPEATLA